MFVKQVKSQVILKRIVMKLEMLVYVTVMQWQNHNCVYYKFLGWQPMENFKR